MSLAVGPNEKVTEVDLSLEGKVKQEDLSTKIYQGTIGSALQEIKPAVKEHKYTWRQQAAAWFKSSWLWRKLFGSATPTPQETSSAKAVQAKTDEMRELTNEQYVNILGMIAQKMLQKETGKETLLCEKEGCFRIPGNVSTVRQAKNELCTMCREGKTLGISGDLSLEEYSSLFKEFFNSLYEKQGELMNLPVELCMANLTGTNADVSQEVVKILQSNEESWNNVKKLFETVASSSKTQWTPENLAVAIPRAKLILKNLFPNSFKEPPK
jgi:hypothetical protein